MNSTCRICKNTENNKIHQTREMMFGIRDGFEYIECGKCGTLQIAEIPDLAKYYPKEYYSLNETGDIEFANSLKRRIAARFAASYFIKGKNPLGKYVAENKDWVHYHFPTSLKENILNLNFHSRILDFGCGAGKLLQTLYHFGFRNLIGADAFIESDIFYPNGVKIYKKTLAELSPFFDLIMLHHSFEHLPNPLETLQEIYKLLEKDKFCLIRIPVVNFAWKKYGVNWVQLDPPRHLFLYTEKSFRFLAEKAGFSVEKIIYDSEEFQFWASEYYTKDIAMNEKNWFNGNFDESIFTEKQFNEWKKKAVTLNSENRGDQACFYLRK